MRQAFGIIILLAYVMVLGVFAGAEYYYRTGKTQKDVAKLKLASQLNPFISDYPAEIFARTKDVRFIQKAIHLETLKPAYHMYYGLELLRVYNRRTRASDKIAFDELHRAYQLKPYSKVYKKIYEQNAKPYLIK